MSDLNGGENWEMCGAAGVCETVEYFREQENLLELLALIGGAIDASVLCNSSSDCIPCINNPTLKGRCLRGILKILYINYSSKKKRYRIEGTDCHYYKHRIFGTFSKEVAEKLCATLNVSLNEGMNEFNAVYGVIEVNND
jgi:hypothetical protein